MTRTMCIAVVIEFLLVGADLPPAPAFVGTIDSCALLAAGEIEAAQKETVRESKSSAHRVKGLDVAQCIFATADVIHSISLTVMTAGGARSRGDAIRTYWAETFGPGRRLGRKNPPRAVPGAGQEAFWTSDARAGVLYVLSGDVVLRLSVGGVSDEEERLRRSSLLAQAALRKLRSE
jgi:hypothetical protein